MNEHDLALLPPAVQAYIRQLEAHAAQASAQIDEAQQHIATLTERIALLEEQFRLAQLKRFAPKSEKQADRLFDEAEQIAAAEAGAGGEEADAAFALPETGLPPTGEAVRGKRGRKPLPADLPRTRIEYDLPDDQKACACCGHALHRMGEQTSEQLHIEVKASVLQHVRLKYACRHCERHAIHTPVVTAPMPAQPLPGGNASPALIATVMTGKYADGTPLYRMAQALARANITVGRGTLSRIALTESSPTLYVRRMRWAAEVVRDLESAGVDVRELSAKRLLRECNSTQLTQPDGLLYLREFFSALMITLDIDWQSHAPLAEHHQAFFDSSAAKLEKLRREGSEFIGGIDFFRKVFRHRSGITVNTIHGVKGAEFDVVIGYGLLEGKVPHFSDENGVDSAKKLLYVVCSRARKHLYLISERGRNKGNWGHYAATETLSACAFDYNIV